MNNVTNQKVNQQMSDQTNAGDQTDSTPVLRLSNIRKSYNQHLFLRVFLLILRLTKWWLF